MVGGECFAAAAAVERKDRVLGCCVQEGHGHGDDNEVASELLKKKGSSLIFLPI